MGQPKKQRRRYNTPAHLFKGREGEAELRQTYGLKNMKEVWKAKSEVSRVRGLARKLLATPDQKAETEILAKLARLGILAKDAKLEDVLNIKVEDILDRRLQTIVYKKSLTTTIKQARQEIVHGHIAIAGQRMSVPAHMVSLEEEGMLEFYPGSPIADPDHPIRKIEKKASTEGAETREVKAEDVKPPSERPEEKPASEPAKDVAEPAPAETAAAKESTETEQIVEKETPSE
jgi:small subunit ribosomal protein S4